MILSLIARIPLLLVFALTVRGNINQITEALVAIKAKGKGNIQAILSREKITSLAPSDIPYLLLAMNDANDLGDNWLRSTIAEILEKNQSSYPEKEIQSFLQNQKNSGSARLQAFEIMQDNNPQIAQSIVPQFLTDREPSLRRLAIEEILVSARNANQDKEAKIFYQKVLENACEVDQIKEASEALAKTGEEIDIHSIMGFVTKWHTIGPFDNSGREGFNTTYPPENLIDLKAKHQGKDGPVEWNKLSTEDPFGMMYINSQYGEIKEVLAYAYNNFISKSEQSVQIRIGSKNAWKLWINGKLLFARDEYHRGKTRVDQFIINGNLKKGRNQILVKVCQNEQTQSWTKQWEFCLRITNPNGKPIHSATQLSATLPSIQK